MWNNVCYYIVRFPDNSQLEFTGQCGLTIDQILQYIRAYGLDITRDTFTVFEYLGSELKRVIPRGLQ